MNQKLITYLLIRLLTYPFRFCSFKILHFIGKGLGACIFFSSRKIRKRILANLLLADLQSSHQSQWKLGKRSCQHLCITLLEYAKLSYVTNLDPFLVRENTEIATELYKKGQGIIFFSGHQANWELPFLDGMTRMQGIAIGRVLSNPYLNKWVNSIRERFGGTIVPQSSAIKNALKALKQGQVVGIVGDQGFPYKAAFAYPFLGRRAWTSTMPALLSYKTKAPIIVITSRREKEHYYIHYSDPIYPKKNHYKPLEIQRLMTAILCTFEKSVRKHPEQWLWMHNRWKQPLPYHLLYKFRFESLLIILPKVPAFEKEKIEWLTALFPHRFITFLSPKQSSGLFKNEEVIYYNSYKECYLKNAYRFKLVLNLTSCANITRYYRKYAKSVVRFNADSSSWKDVLQQTFCHKDRLFGLFAT